jgi:hypothetical protein
MSTRSKVLVFGGYGILLVVFTIVNHKVLIDGWNGIIVGNLLASAYWAPLGIIHLDNLARKHHKEHMAWLHKQRKISSSDSGLPQDSPSSESPPQ